jgi:hypothetical protein
VSKKKEQRQLRVMEKLQAEFKIVDEAWLKYYDEHVKNGNRYYLSRPARWYYLQEQIQNLHRSMKGK